MANQYTVNVYSKDEINEVLSLYELGVSYTMISRKLHRKKNNIKKILIENNVWVKNRDIIKKEFSKIEIQTIIDLYVNENKSTHKIAEMFNVSVSPINRILREQNFLRKGYSDGIKILLTINQKKIIKKLYLDEYKNIYEIAEATKLTSGFINAYLNTVDYRRNKSDGVSVGLVKRFSDVSYDVYLKNLTEREKYRRQVNSLTKKQPIHLLKNHKKRGYSGIDGAYHLDHKYSILEGFKNKIEPEIIASLKNLIFIPWKDNVMKRTKCSITKEELINI